MAGGIRLRAMTFNLPSRRDDLAALSAVVRDFAPDIAIVREGPRRLLWRPRCASLARSLGMYFAGGGMPSLGNVMMTTMRVGVRDVSCMRFPLSPGQRLRGAVVVNCVVGRTRFVVAGSQLSQDSAERPSQAQLLKERLGEEENPVIFAGDLNENSGGAAWRTLADGLVDSAMEMGKGHVGTCQRQGSAERIDAIFVDPRCSVVDYQVIDNPVTRAASQHQLIVAELVLPG